MKLGHAQDLAQDRFFIRSFFFSYTATVYCIPVSVVVLTELVLATLGTSILSDDLALALKEKMPW